MDQFIIREALPEDAEAVLACLKQAGSDAIYPLSLRDA